MDCSLPGSSVHGDSPGKNTEVDCHALLQGIFPTHDETQVSHIAGRLFTICATWKGLGAPNPCPVESLHLTLDRPETYLLTAYYWLEALLMT